MKNMLIAGSLLCLLATACRKQDNDSIFGQKPEERMNKQLTAYQQQLTGNANGWKAYIYPAGGAGFGFFFKFAETNRVNMIGDLTPTSGATLAESSFRLAALQRPSLLFDTYNYLHMLADPDRNVYGGAPGRGYDSDFEFGYDYTSNDTVFLTGNAKGSKMFLVRASAQEEASYKAGQLNTIQEQLDQYTSSHAVIYLSNGDQKIQLSINPSYREFTTVYISDGAFKTKQYTYAHTLQGIMLNEPVTIGAHSFRELILDPAKDVMYFKSGNNNVALETSNDQVFPLHMLMGVSYHQLTTGDATQVAGSASYNAMWQAAKASVAALPYALKLKLNGLNVVFDTNAEQLQMNFLFSQTTNNFTATYTFDYTKASDGTYRFAMQDVQGQLAGILYSSVTPILQKVGAGKFKLGYFKAPGTGQMGQLISVEDPLFFIGGALQ
ncbi:DUF4302 domain-containing protein [Chitinophaga nivalis]|uniref:DUF4302 domain-containing protein n=1 Tax=Chitinophaga nivalis TaxID=2991709 RepID=A0ABT3IET2_9BACT|nr:DUF4302 domain-containing protein [Chitinophaga nivalis]MCW3467903.1 DUF4302 domain-containing protein [Chitinophaga nivalis]MCW3482406.1 DUF4302 domain-containing protein [Chitinophaga nivalis]